MVGTKPQGGPERLDSLREECGEMVVDVPCTDAGHVRLGKNDEARKRVVGGEGREEGDRRRSGSVGSVVEEGGGEGAEVRVKGH